MSDTQALYVVLCVLYLSDCFFWVHRHSIAFTTLTGRRWRAVFPSTTLGNRQGGVVLASPLPPLGPVYFSHLLPVSLSPTHVYSYVSQTLGKGGRPRQQGLLLAYKDITSVEVSGRDIHINGKPFVRSPSPQQAALLADFVKRLLALKEERRAEEIRTALRATFDVEGAGKQIADQSKQSITLRIFCNFAIGYLFLLAPALVWFYGITRFLLPIAVYVWLIAGSIAYIFWRLHRSLFPDARGERVGCVAKMILCPPLAIRASDVLTSQLLAVYHPLAVAALLCSEEDFRRFAKSVLLDLRHPLAMEPMGAGERATEQWYRAILQKLAEEFVAGRGLDLTELLKPSAYMVLEGECADCPGVPLHPFDTRPTAT
jgi:hypothetical protein